jgi:hypothetical protein
MYKRHKVLGIVLFLTTLCLVYIVGVLITDITAGHLITFFSIAFGFQLTSMSMLFGSRYSKSLREKEDPSMKTQTMLHTLKAYFSASSVVSILSISFLLILSLVGMTADSVIRIVPAQIDVWNKTFYLDHIASSMVLGLASINIFFMFLLLKIFFDGFLHEAQKHK